MAQSHAHTQAPITPALRWLLLLVTVSHLAVLWATRWLPMADLGAHVQLLDLAARYNDVELGYRSWYLLPHVLDPGTLPLVVARLLKFIDAWTLARLLLSVYIVGLPLSLLALARAMERPAWLALFAAPLTWNALVNAGLLDALYSLPLLLWCVAVARSMAARGGGGRGALLAVLLVVLYFCHLVYFGVAVVSIVVLFVWYRRDIWSLARLWVLLPSAPLVIQLLYRRLVASQLTAATHLRGPVEEPLTTRLPTRDLLHRLYDWTLLFFPQHLDLALGLCLAAFWLVLLLIGLYDATQVNHGMLDPKSFERRMFGRRKWTWARIRQTVADGSLWRGTFDRRRPRWLNIQQRLTDYGLEALTLVWIGLYLTLPTVWHGVPVVAELMPVPILLLLAVWPRTTVEEWRVWLFVPIVALSVSYGWQVHAGFQEFENREIGDLARQLADLPRAPKLGYVRWEAESPYAYKGALRHLPTAMAAVARGGLMSDNPATLPGSQVHYRRGVSGVVLQPDFWADPALLELDYVILRSRAEPEAALASQRVEHMWHGSGWWLFRVVHGARAQAKLVTAGGRGGQAAYTDCPPGSVLQGFSAQLAPGGSANSTTLGSVTPFCQTPQDGRPGTTPPDILPRLGEEQPGVTPSQLVCPRGQYVVALTGHADTYVRAVQVLCAPQPYPNAQLALLPTRMVGASEAHDFDLHCPEGTVAVGLQGRFGDVVDQLGLVCAEPSRW